MDVFIRADPDLIGLIRV